MSCYKRSFRDVDTALENTYSSLRVENPCAWQTSPMDHPRTLTSWINSDVFNGFFRLLDLSGMRSSRGWVCWFFTFAHIVTESAYFSFSAGLLHFPSTLTDVISWYVCQSTICNFWLHVGRTYCSEFCSFIINTILSWWSDPSTRILYYLSKVSFKETKDTRRLTVNLRVIWYLILHDHVSSTYFISEL